MWFTILALHLIPHTQIYLLMYLYRYIYICIDDDDDDDNDCSTPIMVRREVMVSVDNVSSDLIHTKVHKCIYLCYMCYR